MNAKRACSQARPARSAFARAELTMERGVLAASVPSSIVNLAYVLVALVYSARNSPESEHISSINVRSAVNLTLRC